MIFFRTDPGSFNQSALLLINTFLVALNVVNKFFPKVNKCYVDRFLSSFIRVLEIGIWIV